MINLEGEFFSRKKTGYSSETIECIKKTVAKLEEIEEKPLMMLGKIQSGKTRAFTGVLSLAFDNDYDLAVVLTKNSNALAKQTVVRMKQEFSYFREEELVDVFDIMFIPDRLSKFELGKKIIIVVKKEKNNLPKLMKFIEEYSLSKKKKCLIVDDEADFCSIGYDKNKDNDTFNLRKIASQINDLRIELTCRFLQVTATPYSLYLQPEEIHINSEIIRPVKPYDTILVPHGRDYVGGEYYFDRDKNPLGEYLFEPIDENELGIMKNEDRRKFKEEEILTSGKIKGIREAILNFIVSGAIRTIQNGGNYRKSKYSFILHTEISKASHSRQERIIEVLMEKLFEEAENDSELLEKYLKVAYDKMKISVENYGFEVPDFCRVKEECINSIKEERITRVIVNSESDINTLLDEDGQLKIRTPLTIFIGGQILDRGITINNLIGFYYGRSPQKMQQDTVLQHSRMYGYRDKKDLAVTKFYTTKEIYSKMVTINEFDQKLREEFENGNFEKGIIFISKDDSGKIIPCSPEKIKISNTQVLRGGKTITPIGFETYSKTKIKRNIEEIDKILKFNNNGNLKGQFIISKDEAVKIIKLIYETFEIQESNCVSGETFSSLIKYLTKNYMNIYCGVDRNISRLRETDRYYSDMPYNRDNDLKKSKEMAKAEPTLMLMRQNGTVERGWSGAEFYWPVLIVQENIDTAVYASEILK